MEKQRSKYRRCEPAPKLVRAAQYVRMSTEHQQYSTENQADMIREYAARRGYEIVRTYADDGKSGLKIEGRDSLRSMIEDVQTGNANFAAIPNSSTTCCGSSAGSAPRSARDAATDLLLINGEYTASMVLSRCRQTAGGLLRWLVRIDQTLVPDITILVRMDATNQQPADYYLLPIMDIAAPKLLLCESNGVYLDTYQFDNLDYFTIMAKRRKIEVAA